MSTPDQLQLFALPGLPMVRPGDDLADLIIASLARAGRTLVDRDVLVVAQKIVSKAENRVVDLATVTPGPAPSHSAPRSARTHAWSRSSSPNPPASCAAGRT
jgi:coenzyme F420-0:L-glutamate ligase/coenzyme F420-1:gamma-L-glutamate ligase